jgi:hypothetical protein
MDDLLLCVCEYLLLDKDKLSILSTTMFANRLKKYVFFKQKVLLSKIQSLFYLDNFLNVISNQETKLPYHAKSIYFPSTTRKCNIPNKTRKLRFGIEFYFDDPYILPLSVKRLTINDGHHNLQNIICPNVNHLTLHIYNYRYLETLNIPSHITSLKLYHEIDKSYKKIIPATVTHLCLENYNGFNVFNSVPVTVTHLKVYQCHLSFYTTTIPTHITHLLLVDDYCAIEEISDHPYENIPASLVEFIIHDQRRNKRIIKK